MRILEMVQCGCRAAQPEDVMLPVQEVPSGGTGRYRRKVHQRTGPGKMSSGQWRPSLGNILEDADQGRKCGSAAANSAKMTGRGVPKSRKEDYRQMEVPTTMPAYAPTAFLF
ncbi:hypothetical protein LUZ62_018042 [Rhynchospora pubera]|uniref:Uncharacterized protein n=1 Tax=Rhynchospora pubera TaxID=906938 RepID=A0AAV8GNK9_9POAL|nr:hypothetical protein LUZ62_018042 [Rhynchospora pubera]